MTPEQQDREREARECEDELLKIEGEIMTFDQAYKKNVEQTKKAAIAARKVMTDRLTLLHALVQVERQLLRNKA